MTDGRQAARAAATGRAAGSVHFGVIIFYCPSLLPPYCMDGCVPPPKHRSLDDGPQGLGSTFEFEFKHQHPSLLQDLTDDYGLLKKLKKGKISQHEFNVATGLSSDDEAEEEVVAVKKNGAARGAVRKAEGEAEEQEEEEEEGGTAVLGGRPKAKQQKVHSRQGAAAFPVDLVGSKTLQQYEDLKRRRQKRRGKGGIRG